MGRRRVFHHNSAASLWLVRLAFQSPFPITGGGCLEGDHPRVQHGYLQHFDLYDDSVDSSHVKDDMEVLDEEHGRGGGSCDYDSADGMNGKLENDWGKK